MSRASSRVVALDVQRPGERGTRPRQKRRPLVRPFGGGARRPLRSKLAPLSRLVLCLLRKEIQVDEDLDLGPQDLRNDRRNHEIDGAQRVPLGRADFVSVVRGDEDDRHMRGPFPAANQLGRLQAVHSRHVDVEEDDGELVLQHLPERLLARIRGDEVLAELLENRAVDDVLVGAIVDEKNVRPVLRRTRRSSLSVPWLLHRSDSAPGCLNDGATPGAFRSSARFPPASTGSPRRRLRCISPGLPSSPWRSRR